jgi:putative nucleotidyltransferase with HDIG domain
MLLMPALKKRLESESTVGNLPALEGILTDLQKFTNDPTATTFQISEQISRDPSLSVRLLHLSNSAYYNRSEPVVSIEEAVLFLGVEQIKMVSMSMNCVEKMSPQDKCGFEWTDFWRHCIATAFFARMLGRFFVRPNSDRELDYMAGLLHDVGKLVIATIFPDGFGYVLTKARQEKLSFSEAERAYFDTDHGALGGWYLERQKVPPMVSEAVRCHHNWTLSVENQEIAAIVNVADAFTHECGIGCSGSMQEIHEPFTETPAWFFLLQRVKLRSDVALLEYRLREEAKRIESLVDAMIPRPAPKPAAQQPQTPAPAPSVDLHLLPTAEPATHAISETAHQPHAPGIPADSVAPLPVAAPIVPAKPVPVPVNNLPKPFHTPPLDLQNPLLKSANSA